MEELRLLSSSLNWMSIDYVLLLELNFSGLTTMCSGRYLSSGEGGGESGEVIDIKGYLTLLADLGEKAKLVYMLLSSSSTERVLAIIINLSFFTSFCFFSLNDSLRRQNYLIM